MTTNVTKIEPGKLFLEDRKDKLVVSDITIQDSTGKTMNMTHLNVIPVQQERPLREGEIPELNERVVSFIHWDNRKTMTGKVVTNWKFLGNTVCKVRVIGGRGISKYTDFNVDFDKLVFLDEKPSTKKK